MARGDELRAVRQFRMRRCRSQRQHFIAHPEEGGKYHSAGQYPTNGGKARMIPLRMLVCSCPRGIQLENQTGVCPLLDTDASRQQGRCDLVGCGARELSRRLRRRVTEKGTVDRQPGRNDAGSITEDTAARRAKMATSSGSLDLISNEICFCHRNRDQTWGQIGQASCQAAVLSPTLLCGDSRAGRLSVPPEFLW